MKAADPAILCRCGCGEPGTTKAGFWSRQCSAKYARARSPRVGMLDGLQAWREGRQQVRQRDLRAIVEAIVSGQMPFEAAISRLEKRETRAYQRGFAQQQRIKARAS